jgi:hypothetical protein
MAAGRRNALVLELHGSAESLRFDQERPEELWLGGRTESRILLRDPATAALIAEAVLTSAETGEWVEVGA